MRYKLFNAIVGFESGDNPPRELVLVEQITPGSKIFSTIWSKMELIKAGAPFRRMDEDILIAESDDLEEIMAAHLTDFL